MATGVSEAIRSEVQREPIFTLEGVIPVMRNGHEEKYLTTVTVGRIGELLRDETIVVDYDYQRGYKASYGPDGDPRFAPMVDTGRVDEIAVKILENRLFGGALTWSLRRNEVVFDYNPVAKTLRVFQGRPTIPDSNHRHQAMQKVFELVESRGYRFDVDAYEFPLVIEVLDLDQERALFHEYNQLGKPANPTRSRYINQADPHSALTSAVIDHSKLEGHVELVTNNLSKNSPKVVTFNALVTAVKAGFPDLDDSNFDGIRDYLVEFVDHLTEVRPETGYMPLAQRKQTRESRIGDSAVAFYGYGKLAGDLYGFDEWKRKLSKLGESYRYTNMAGETWEGDLMSRENPIWESNVLLRGRAGNLQISNNRETRQFIHERLREVVGLDG